MVKISQDEVRLIIKYIYDISGIFLNNSKVYLLETRLGDLLDRHGFSSYRELYLKAKNDKSKVLEKDIINRITTNETLFFRDSSPFELLQHKILPDLIDLRTGSSNGATPVNINIWSSACSTGQEVYSIAIVLKELLGTDRRYNIKLMGTDISDEAVAKASYGEYNRFEVERGLSPDKLKKYFILKDNTWKVRDEIRAMATFKKLNLMYPFNGLGRFDIIFCRNVAIYFSLEDRKKLFDRLARILNRDGSLVIGSTESLTGISELFEPRRYLRSIFYQLKE